MWTYIASARWRRSIVRLTDFKARSIRSFQMGSTVAVDILICVFLQILHIDSIESIMSINNDWLNIKTKDLWMALDGSPIRKTIELFVFVSFERFLEFVILLFDEQRQSIFWFIEKFSSFEKIDFIENHLWQLLKQSYSAICVQLLSIGSRSELLTEIEMRNNNNNKQTHRLVPASWSARTAGHQLAVKSISKFVFFEKQFFLFVIKEIEVLQCQPRQ